MPDNKFLENSLRSSKTPALLHVATRIGDVALNRFVEGISRIKRIPPPCRISYVYSCLYILYFYLNSLLVVRSQFRGWSDSFLTSNYRIYITCRNCQSASSNSLRQSKSRTRSNADAGLCSHHTVSLFFSLFYLIFSRRHVNSLTFICQLFFCPTAVERAEARRSSARTSYASVGGDRLSGPGPGHRLPRDGSSRAHPTRVLYLTRTLNTFSTII